MTSESSQPLISLAVLASGSGSNAAAMVEYFTAHKFCRIEGIWTNSPKAGVLSRDLSVPVHVFAPGAEDDRVIDQWKAAGISAVVCAGYLKLIPAQWIRAFPHRIWNVHPALLPKHGGPGMYGLHIHRAVLAAGDAESGLTVHEVSERYDEGRALFQCRVPVAPQDGPEDLQARILRAEHWALPRVVEALLLNQPLPRPDQCPA